MEKPQKILCVCFGNSDRSPVMSAVLNMFLKNTGHKVICESAGVDENALKGGPISPYSVAGAKKIGLDISEQVKRHINSIRLEDYDLIITVDEISAGILIYKHGVDINKVYNAQVTNVWPCKSQIDFDNICMTSILTSMYRVVCRYF